MIQNYIEHRNDHGKRLMRTLGDRHRIHTRHVMLLTWLSVNSWWHKPLEK